MEFLLSLVGACTNIKKADTNMDMDASEIQLNAFEFRNYRVNLDLSQQKLLERMVNQTCASLVKGKNMTVNENRERVLLDKDLLTLWIHNTSENFLLKDITKMELYHDESMEDSWGLHVFFGEEVEILFSFGEERLRLAFALTLRILRTRDPELDLTNSMVVDREKDRHVDEREKNFDDIVGTQHYNVDRGLPIVFSVSDMKLFHKLQSTSRHVYLEFFVKYPRQDRFLYAKSPTTHIPPQVLVAEGAALRKKKEKKDDDQDEEERKREETKRQVLGQDIPIGAMRFDLKNVKLKIPRVPHTIFGRLMAKDDYFPTAVGTFEFQFKEEYLQDRREPHAVKKKDKKKEQALKGVRKEPEVLTFPVMSSWKANTGGDEKEDYLKIGSLTIRVIGYVTDPESDNHAKQQKGEGSSSGSEEGSEEASEEGEDDE